MSDGFRPRPTTTPPSTRTAFIDLTARAYGINPRTLRNGLKAFQLDLAEVEEGGGDAVSFMQGLHALAQVLDGLDPEQANRALNLTMAAVVVTMAELDPDAARAILAAFKGDAS